MGLTIECVKTETGYDLGYGGFGNFREKVAELYSSIYSEHFKKLCTPEMMFCFDKEKRKSMFEDYNRKTNELIMEHNLDVEIIDFLLQPDSGGSISATTCKKIYDVIKNYDDNICYGYLGRPDCTMFRHLKSLFLECYENNSELIWE